MKTDYTVCLLALTLLAGCEKEPANQTEAMATSKVEKPQTVEERIAAKNAQDWEDGRVYITENNYVIYDQGTGKPRYFVFKAKEWPREDLNNKASYDLPRVVFRWDNARKEAEDHYDQKDKVWSIKTDGTDLRLVADEFTGMVRLMRMSPNNRYLALAYSTGEGMFKVIKDLKTGEYTELGHSRGYPEFLWAEDSSYLYYDDQFDHWKYTLATDEKERIETEFNEYSVIHGGKRFMVDDFGIGVFDEKLDKEIYSIVPDSSGPANEMKFHSRSISPDGRYAWAETNTKRYLIDVENKTFQMEEIVPRAVGTLRYFDVLGKDAKFVRNGAAEVILSRLMDNKRFGPYLMWKQIGTGHSATDSSLYNAFANNGDFVKGDAL